MTSVERVEKMLAQKRVRALARVLRRGDNFARRRAAQALGELRAEQAIAELATALREDRDQYVRRWAVEALRDIATPDAVGALTEAVFSTRPGMSRSAQIALEQIDTPEARAALHLREALVRGQWSALETLDENARPALFALLHSDQYPTWPASRRQPMLRAAVRLGVTPPARLSRELAEMGLYVSGVHSLIDLFTGMNNRNPRVREAAAARLGESGLRWARYLLYPRFRLEMRPGGEAKVAAALARALGRLGDGRAVAYLRDQIQKGGHPAQEAAYLLAEIRTDEAVEALFWYAADPPPPPAYRNTPLMLSALENAGPQAADALRRLSAHDEKAVRRLLVDVIARSGHPECVEMLGTLAADADEGVQRAAVDALARLNTREAAEKLRALDAELPSGWVERALAAMSSPAGPAALREMRPDATTLRGKVYDGYGVPMKGGTVQVLQEQFDEESANWLWQPVSIRIETPLDGTFDTVLIALDGGERLRLQLTMPPRPGGGKGYTYEASLPVKWQSENYVEVALDRVFDRLVVTPVQPEDLAR